MDISKNQWKSTGGLGYQWGYPEILGGLIDKKTQQGFALFIQEILVHCEKMKNCPLVQCVFDEKADNIN